MSFHFAINFVENYDYFSKKTLFCFQSLLDFLSEEIPRRNNFINELRNSGRCECYVVKCQPLSLCLSHNSVSVGYLLGVRIMRYICFGHAFKTLFPFEPTQHNHLTLLSLAKCTTKLRKATAKTWNTDEAQEKKN